MRFAVPFRSGPMIFFFLDNKIKLGGIYFGMCPFHGCLRCSLTCQGWNLDRGCWGPKTQNTNRKPARVNERMGVWVSLTEVDCDLLSGMWIYNNKITSLPQRVALFWLSQLTVQTAYVCTVTVEHQGSCVWSRINALYERCHDTLDRPRLPQFIHSPCLM